MVVKKIVKSRFRRLVHAHPICSRSIAGAHSAAKVGAMALAPPMNFAMVTPGVYRSGFPTRHNLGFLQTLGLRTLVRIENAEFPSDLQAWIESCGIQVVDCVLTTNVEPFQTIDPAMLATALATVVDSKHHPVLVHSIRGQRRTGVLVGCFRRLQGWSLAAVFEE